MPEDTIKIFLLAVF